MRFTYTKRRFSTGARAESRPRLVNFGKNAPFAYTKWQFFENRRFTCTKRPLCANVSVSPTRNRNFGPCRAPPCGFRLLRMGPEIHLVGPELLLVGPELLNAGPELLPVGPELLSVGLEPLPVGQELFPVCP